VRGNIIEDNRVKMSFSQILGKKGISLIDLNEAWSSDALSGLVNIKICENFHNIGKKESLLIEFIM